MNEPVLVVLIIVQFGLGIGLLRLAREFQTLRSTVTTVIRAADAEHQQLMHAGDGDGDGEGEPSAALAPGAQVQVGPDGAGQWSLWVLVSSDCGTCHDVVTALDSVAAQLPQFRLSALFVDAVPDRLALGPAVSVGAAPVWARDAEVPSAYMIGPDGVVAGAGRISSASELLTFVREGSAHGFGPAALQPVGAGHHNHD